MTSDQMKSFTLRITQANPTEMIVILYEMVLVYIEECREAIAKQDEEMLQDAVRKVKACLSELMHSLNMKYEPAPAILKLLGYCVRKMTMVSINRNTTLLEEVEAVIKPIKESFEQIAPQNTKGSVMNNSQSVYVGLTYGKNTLTENTSSQNINRGVYA